MTYEELYGGFRWQVPAHVNLGIDVCERHPRDAVAIVVTDGREVTRRVTFGELSEDSNRLANASAGSRDRATATGSGSRCRSGRRRPSRTSPSTSWARSLCRCRRASARTRWRCGSDDAEPAVVLADRELEGVETIDVDRELPALLAAASPTVRAGRDRGRRAGADRLHLGNDRAAEGRAARAPRPARASAGVRALARLLPAAGRPDLDAGGLGLDGRSLRRAHARPLPRPAGACVPDDEVRPGARRST